MKSPREPGAPLGHYLWHHPGTDVELFCSKCMKGRVLPMGRVLIRLYRRGHDPFLFGIRDVAQLVTAPCPCGGGSWTTRPHFAPPRMGMKD